MPSERFARRVAWRVVELATAVLSRSVLVGAGATRVVATGELDAATAGGDTGTQSGQV